MPNKLGFYLHSSQDDHGLWNLFQRVKPPVALIHLEFKNDMLLTQMREWRSPDTTGDWRSFRLLGADNQGRRIEIMDWIAERLAQA
jgi:hypothetical protein